MSEPVAGVNPRLLTWARERAGRSIEDVAQALKKDAAVIEAWERGEGAPTYIQLENLAYVIYKRPIAIFFFPEPPDEPDPEHSFRTLPDFELQNLSADTRYKIRKARAMQLSLAELLDEGNPSDRKIFRDIRPEPSAQPISIAEQVRGYLRVQVADQARWSSTSDALSKWRMTLEGVGVFVFKDSFEQDDVSGFCLIDDEFPVIYVNNSTPFSRQIFTLFHELAHILVQANGVTKRDDRYIESLKGVAREVEVFCNRFAGEFLVPSSHFLQRLQGRQYDDILVADFADYYNVSREVVLRKFLDHDKITSDFYRQKVREWEEEMEALEGRTGGGNYYANQATYLGERYLRLAFSRYYQGRCSIEQLADYLNVKVASIPGLEQYGLR